MPDIDAAPDARIHTLHGAQYIQRRMPQLILGPVIMDRHADVVLLYELLDSRQCLGCMVVRDNNGNTSPLAVFELAADIRIFILFEIAVSGGVALAARCA